MLCWRSTRQKHLMNRNPFIKLSWDQSRAFFRIFVCFSFGFGDAAIIRFCCVLCSNAVEKLELLENWCIPINLASEWEEMKISRNAEPSNCSCVLFLVYEIKKKNQQHFSPAHVHIDVFVYMWMVDFNEQTSTNPAVIVDSMHVSMWMLCNIVCIFCLAGIFACFCCGRIWSLLQSTSVCYCLVVSNVR